MSGPREPRGAVISAVIVARSGCSEGGSFTEWIRCAKESAKGSATTAQKKGVRDDHDETDAIGAELEVRGGHGPQQKTDPFDLEEFSCGYGGGGRGQHPATGWSTTAAAAAKCARRARRGGDFGGR